MTERSLQVTDRKGRTLAAYLHLSHLAGEKSARTVVSPEGLLCACALAAFVAVSLTAESQGQKALATAHYTVFTREGPKPISDSLGNGWMPQRS